MYWVEIKNDKITGKGQGKYKTDEQIEISEEIYNQLTTLPADCVIKENKILSVSPIETLSNDIVVIEKTETIEERVNKLEQRIATLEATR